MNDEEHQPLVAAMDNGEPEQSSQQRTPWGKIFSVSALLLAIGGVIMLSSSARKSNSLTAADQLQLAETGSIKYTSLSRKDQLSLFGDFKKQYEREYKDSDLETQKFENFQAFLQMVDDNNAKEQAAGGSAVHGITQFADLSVKEFNEKYLSGVRQPMELISSANTDVTHMKDNVKDLAALAEKKTSTGSVKESSVPTLPLLEDMIEKYNKKHGIKASDVTRSLSSSSSHKTDKSEPTSKSASKGAEVATACQKSTCYGQTCDYWVANGYTCSDLTKYYGCDCTGCSCSISPTAAPTGSGKCVSTCYGHNCDYWYGYTCSNLEKSYGCDCSGCQCTYGAPTAKPTPYPTSVGAKDWSGIYTTSVNNQGVCGSCWAHAAVEQMEADAIRQGILPLSDTSKLSIQELVSCDPNDHGCEGGWPSNAYNWVQSNGGITTSVNYPYSDNAATRGTADKCVLPSSSSNVVTVQSWGTQPTETAMQNHVIKTGPLAIALDATVLQTYKSGVISAAGCSSNNQNHAVQLVGVDLSNNYFKVRNSWGPSWGESGYFRVETRTGQELNACNIVGYVCPSGYTCPTGGTYTSMLAIKRSETPKMATKDSASSSSKAKSDSKEEKKDEKSSDKADKKGSKKEGK